MGENYLKRRENENQFYLRRKLEAKKLRTIIFTFSSSRRKRFFSRKIEKIMKKDYNVDYVGCREIAFCPKRSIYFDGTFQEINEIVDEIMKIIDGYVTFCMCTYSKNSKGYKVKFSIDLNKYEIDEKIEQGEILRIGFFGNR